METHRLSDIKIKVCVVPKRLRWPERGSSVAWAKLHSCVDGLQDLVRSVDVACTEVEQSRQLSAGAIAHRRAELCDQALRKLANFQPFDIAEKTLTQNIDELERLNNRNPEQAQMLQKLAQALNDLREGIAATRRMVLDRCKMRSKKIVIWC